jgi:hypothetical protein
MNKLYENEETDFDADYIRIMQLNLIAFYFAPNFLSEVLITLLGNFIIYWRYKLLGVRMLLKPTKYSSEKNI